MVMFEGSNKVGVAGKGFIIVIYNFSFIHINVFTFIVEDNVLCFAVIYRHHVGPEPSAIF